MPLQKRSKNKFLLQKAAFTLAQTFSTLKKLFVSFLTRSSLLFKI